MLHLPETGVVHKLPDALSRHPPTRDDLILARIGEWTQLRSVIKGVGEQIEAGALDCEDGGLSRDSADVAAPVAEEGGNGAPGVSPRSSAPAIEEPRLPLSECCFLVLGGYLAEEAEQKRIDYWIGFLRKRS